jgi:hypothetical protein
VDLVAEEGSMAPIGTATETVLEAFEQLTRRYNQSYQIALDMAAYNLFSNGQYTLGGQTISFDQLGATYMQWDQRFPILSIEDPFAENDLEGLKYLLTQPSRKFMVVGDATTATAAGRIAELGQQRLIGGVVIKPDQTGTITEMLDAIRAALQSGVKVILAHRSGETNDTYLADIAYGAGAFGLKAGAPLRGERVAKYNRLIEIAADIKPPVVLPNQQPASQRPIFTGTQAPPVPATPQPQPPVSIPTPPAAQAPLMPVPMPTAQTASAVHFDRPLYPLPPAAPAYPTNTYAPPAPQPQISPSISYTSAPTPVPPANFNTSPII